MRIRIAHSIRTRKIAINKRENKKFFDKRDDRFHFIKMTSCNSSRPKSLMELLLAKKIEAASTESSISTGRRLLRTDSMDSVSSIGSCTSSMLGEDVCRCDDCLLGIVDLYVIPPQTKALHIKKVTANEFETNFYRPCEWRGVCARFCALKKTLILNANKRHLFTHVHFIIIMARKHHTGIEAITGLF